jgi:hypothetical protein
MTRMLGLSAATALPATASNPMATMRANMRRFLAEEGA